MAAGQLYNLARMTTATTLTGTITLGAAASGYLTFAQAGVPDGAVVSYGITDGSNSEHGFGTYTAAGTTLTRNPTRSTNANAAISLSGSAQVFICPRAEDLLSMAGAQTFTTAEKNQGRANISAIGVVKTQVFPSSGTYTPSTGMLFCIIEAVGGGGAGGGAGGNVSLTFSGAGGGSGSYSRLYASAATIGASKTVTIGGGGGGAVNGTGSAGGDTSVGVICIAKGGSGGTTSNSGAGPQPGAGGVTGTGDVVVVGHPGGPGLYNSNNGNLYIASGNGGNGFFGGGALGQVPSGAVAVAGNNGSTGGGGGGAYCHQTASNAAGGSGGNGYVVITEFCTQ